MSWKEKLEIINDENADREIKLYLMISGLHEQQITYKKTLELCAEIGVFSENWIAIDAKMVEYTTRKNK